MGFLKNRTMLGVLCIVLSLLICFAVTPLFNQIVSQKKSIFGFFKEDNSRVEGTGPIIPKS